MMCVLYLFIETLGVPSLCAEPCRCASVCVLPMMMVVLYFHLLAYRTCLSATSSQIPEERFTVAGANLSHRFATCSSIFLKVDYTQFSSYQVSHRPSS
ncbi:hypothetical protein F5Y06DRAFT_145868 [Hypoxylon sp. FL0890]|nr:hypothetical protein F5Y06DRAFT_145868 [Hypoxylon sp. FL0890]